MACRHLTSRDGWKGRNERRHDDSDELGELCITRYAYANTHTCARTRTHVPVLAAAPRDVSRRSSRQILFRKIGLPLSSTAVRRQLCVGGSVPTYQYTRNACASASQKLSGLSPRSSLPTPPNLSLFSSAHQTAISHDFGVSQPRKMSPRRWIQASTVGSRIYISTHDNIAK